MLGAEVGILGSLPPAEVERSGRVALEAADGLRIAFVPEDGDAPARLAGELAMASRKALCLEVSGAKWDELARRLARLAETAESAGARDLVLGVRLAIRRRASVPYVCLPPSWRRLVGGIRSRWCRSPASAPSTSPTAMARFRLGCRSRSPAPLMDGIGDIVQVVQAA